MFLCSWRVKSNKYIKGQENNGCFEEFKAISAVLKCQNQELNFEAELQYIFCYKLYIYIYLIIYESVLSANKISKKSKRVAI